jgi:hypothetical protein
MMAPLVELWLKAVRAEGERRMFAGQVVPGFKLVQGKRGARRWSDAEAAEQQLKAMRLKVEEMFDLSLISPTAAERLTKAKDGEKPAIGPRQWAKLQTLIVQPDGKPSVVPVTDARKALAIAPPADDFEVHRGAGMKWPLTVCFVALCALIGFGCWVSSASRCGSLA